MNDDAEDEPELMESAVEGYDSGEDCGDQEEQSGDQYHGGGDDESGGPGLGELIVFVESQDEDDDDCWWYHDCSDGSPDNAECVTHVQRWGHSEYFLTFLTETKYVFMSAACFIWCFIVECKTEFIEVEASQV